MSVTSDGSVTSYEVFGVHDEFRMPITIVALFQTNPVRLASHSACVQAAKDNKKVIIVGDIEGRTVQAPPRRHRSLGKIGAQRITIYTERM